MVVNCFFIIFFIWDNNKMIKGVAMEMEKVKKKIVFEL